MTTTSAATPRSLPLTLVLGLLCGMAATVAKGKAEAWGQPTAEKVWPPTDAERGVGGADPSGHPENMPPTVLVKRLAAGLGKNLDDEAAATASNVVHLATGWGGGVAYALIARAFPAIRIGSGVPAGLALYASTHGSALPGAKLQPFPWAMPRAAVAWEAGSHAVYGAVLDLGLRFADTLS